MADQQRWFKLWTTAPSDDALQLLPPERRWSWAVFGCYTKVHGTHGRVVVSDTNTSLAAQMCVTVESLFDVIKSFPNVVCEEGKKRHGEITVTWRNWVKYQEDSTQAERQRTSRSKRRGEERRGEENIEELTKNVSSSSTVVWETPVADVHDRLHDLNAPECLHEPDYWLRIHQWIEGTKLQIYYLDELKAYLAWHASQNGHKKHKDLKRGYRNWLSTAVRMRERDAQRTYQHTK